VTNVTTATSTWADFRARAMLDWWDWAPVARAIEKGIIANRGEQGCSKDSPDR